MDDDLHAEIREDTLDEVLEFFPRSKNAFRDQASDLKSAIDSVSDILGSSAPSATDIYADYNHLRSRVSELRESVGSYEAKHAEADFTRFHEIYDALKQLIEQYLNASNTVKLSYTSGDVTVLYLPCSGTMYLSAWYMPNCLPSG